ncbi:MAG: DUF2752 domain-containing protein [Planctomycetes bacterium]|nr:DUF2752 domain-containing protein [Planctomycetota bacterium]
MRVVLAKNVSRAPTPWELYSLIVVGGAAVYIPFFMLRGLHLPSSPTRELWNFPCPLCGGTRSVASLMLGRLDVAFQYNPLAPLVLAVLVLTVAHYLLLVLPAGRRVVLQATPPQRKVLIALLVLVFVANWAYVLIARMYDVPLREMIAY